VSTEPKTHLTFQTDSYKFEDESQVVAIRMAPEGPTAVVLNQTIFYPQGGGQPCDRGTIQSNLAKFEVVDVRIAEGLVYHYGKFESGHFTPGEHVRLSVDQERRMLNARLHSAGHLIDIAIQNLKLNLKPGKGYHFPDGPYVEYIGALDDCDKDSLLQQIAQEAKRLIDQNLCVNVTVTDADGAESLCGELPEYVDINKPVRVVAIGDGLGCPCGGTHVKELKDLGNFGISKIRTKADRVKVSYAVQ
jgi:Ser-tRNA(Ala) deacylase AlaX